MPASSTIYWHTLRHLKPVQIYGRLGYRMFRPRPNLAPAPPMAPKPAIWVPPLEKLPNLVAPDRFRFLNREHSVKVSVDWNNPDWEKLWLYNLHYFDDLNAEGGVARQDWHRALIGRWIAENPPGHGNGWEPYPTSLRIVNWIKWALAGNELSPLWVQSLAVQVRWLRQRLEWHLLGNHLFTNAKALVFAGLFFRGDEADRWLKKGIRILASEVPEQVLVDGGHFERSPMYHAIILEDLLDLIDLAQCYPGRIDDETLRRWRDVARPMLRWLAGLSHPDGRISFFNDAAFGVAAEPKQLFAYFGRLGLGVGEAAGGCHFSDSGYVRLESGPAVAILDVAPVGPDHLPGHAHADTLSFELSLFGERVIVNSGTSVYGTGVERLRQRGTAAHSTVELDGADSSEVWGGFRVARRAKPLGLLVGAQNGAFRVRCGHDGYRRLAGKPLHWREWRVRHKGLEIEDRLEGRWRMAVARYHLHPGVQVCEAGEDYCTLRTPGGHVVRVSFTGGGMSVEESTYHPEFGKNLPNRVLRVRFEGAVCSAVFSWGS